MRRPDPRRMSDEEAGSAENEAGSAQRRHVEEEQRVAVRRWPPSAEAGWSGGGIRQAAGKQELEAAVADEAELKHAALAPKARPRGGTGGEEPEAGRGWPPWRSAACARGGGGRL